MAMIQDLISFSDLASLKISVDNIIDSAFLFRPSTMVMLWIIVYSSDWLMNYWGTRLYKKQVKSFCVFEDGYNLNHISLDELDHPSSLLLRYFSELLITTTGIWLLLYVCKLYSNWGFFEFFCGFFILLETCVHFRHVRNVTLFSLMSKNSGLYGSLAVPRWLSLRAAFVEFGSFGIGFLVVYFFDSSNFFVLGGSVACFIALVYNYHLSEKEKKNFKARNPEITHMNEFPPKAET